MKVLQCFIIVLGVSTVIVLGEVLRMPLSMQYNRALTTANLRILVGLSLQKCWMECQGRLKCLSINYKATICELNGKQQNVHVPLGERTGSVYMEKPFGPQPNVLQCGFQLCDIREVCDIRTNSCSIKECEPFIPPENGMVYGNDFAVGRKVRVGCKRGFVSSNTGEATLTSTCLENGTWDIHPYTCREITTSIQTTTAPTTGDSSSSTTSTPVTTIPVLTTQVSNTSLPLSSLPTTTPPVSTTQIATTTMSNIPTTTSTSTTPRPPETTSQVSTTSESTITSLPTTTPGLIRQWVAQVVAFSSQYDTRGWSANQIIGAPDVYPSYGDKPGTWATEIQDAYQFIEIRFNEPVQVHSLEIYETFNAGSVKAIKAKYGTSTWTTIWSTTNVRVLNFARVFVPELLVISNSTRDFRIELNCTVKSSWVEIDAVRLVGIRV